MSRKVCLVGSGNWGENHLKTLDRLNNLDGLVEINKNIREKISKNYPDIKIFSNLEESFLHNFDGYVVATPAPTHYQISKKIITHGYHILIEKPMTLSYNDAISLVNLANEYNVNIMVGHVLLFHPAIKKIKEMIINNEIGELRYIYSNRLNLGEVRKEENVFWSFAPHDISLLQFLIGKFPLDITIKGGSYIQEGIHDTTLTILEYPNNIKAHIYLSWLHPFKEHRIVIIGSKGMISFEDSSPDKQLKFYKKKFIINGDQLEKDDNGVELINYSKDLPLDLELKYFIKHLNGDKINICNGEDGANVIKILEEASKGLEKS
tara:strand:- start:269 stop:1231 length:963 start_codon:yes stop_codon:yes gene_type:complete